MIQMIMDQASMDHLLNDPEVLRTSAIWRQNHSPAFGSLAFCLQLSCLKSHPGDNITCCLIPEVPTYI
jgi:hypothetical protein